MTKEIDNKVKEYLDRACNMFFADHIKDMDTLDKDILTHVPSKDQEEEFKKVYDRVIQIAELIQREEHFAADYPRQMVINGDKLTDNQVKEVIDIVSNIGIHKVSIKCDPDLEDPANNLGGSNG